ncbi:uncharacterized protein TEOVI_000856700 [Trypanosoma equiperdum]|uniref:Uncharacterized protein n=2 Tax=Trypanozoon TaxID=39700 RepID=Q4GYF4_TRYB2|nr:hypothetical protein, unlikely [Trypanosoma brucei brucei TREU927]CAJ16630.1 hypothetical protein, unlikely [Trypanosoma brucei brucei TREU927]SCU67538.1 hypothetical protein, conserved [Trypanosoma equiperdum]
MCNASPSSPLILHKQMHAFAFFEHQPRHEHRRLPNIAQFAHLSCDDSTRTKKFTSVTAYTPLPAIDLFPSTLCSLTMVNEEHEFKTKKQKTTGIRAVQRRLC